MAYQDSNNTASDKPKFRQLRYPYDRIENDMDVLKIDIAEYVPPFQNAEGELFSNENAPLLQAATGTRSNQEQLKNPLYQIILPIPKQLSDVSAVDWTDGQLNPLEAAGLNAVGGVLSTAAEGGNISQKTQDTLSQFINTAGSLAINENTKKAVIAALSGQAIGTLGGNVSGRSLVSRATGQVFQPNLELLFNGVNLRVFPFSFEFFPRNQKEGFEVKNILRVLKYSMVPSKSGSEGLFIKAPYIFQLCYMKGDGTKHPFLNKFLPMALTSMNIVYTGANTYSTFYDGTPTHMRVDLVFKEINPIYKEDYDTLNNSGDTSVGY